MPIIRLTGMASYQYDPFGNTISQSGILADANVYRFSSKEFHAKSGLYYYLLRFYDPNSQRWINRDPMQELFGLNMYAFVRNSPVAAIDLLGLAENGDWGGTWWPNPSGGRYVNPRYVFPRDPIYLMPDDAMVNPASGSGSVPAAIGSIGSLFDPTYYPETGAGPMYYIKLIIAINTDPGKTPTQIIWDFEHTPPPGKCWIASLRPSAPPPPPPPPQPPNPYPKIPWNSGSNANSPPAIVIR
jgi:RHS repeat-associated protein